MKNNSLEKAINYNNITLFCFCKVLVQSLSKNTDENPHTRSKLQSSSPQNPAKELMGASNKATKDLLLRHLF